MHLNTLWCCRPYRQCECHCCTRSVSLRFPGCSYCTVWSSGPSSGRAVSLCSSASAGHSQTNLRPAQMHLVIEQHWLNLNPQNSSSTHLQSTFFFIRSIHVFLHKLVSHLHQRHVWAQSQQDLLCLGWVRVVPVFVQPTLQRPGHVLQHLSLVANFDPTQTRPGGITSCLVDSQRSPTMPSVQTT